MHLSKRFFLAPMAVIAVASTGFSDQKIFTTTAESADSAAVAAAVTAFHGALNSGDSARALALLAPDATILESGGVESRAEYRSHHLPADIEFAKAVASKRGPLVVTVSGSTAWTTNASTTEGEFRGRRINSTGAETMVLTKEPAGWLIRSIHWSSATRRTTPPATK